jgi:hypothetical protein
MGKETLAMSEFVFLYRGSVTYKTPGEPQFSPAEMQEHLGKWRIWLKELHDKGIVKNLGSPLEQPCKVIRGQKKAVTDGPYAEKDLVSGFTIVEAKDHEQAVEIATGCPIFLMGGSVEVRPVMKMSM